MSDFEILMIVLTIVGLIVAIIKKQPHLKHQVRNVIEK